jgi:S1-C subfamily serine protease
MPKFSFRIVFFLLIFLVGSNDNFAQVIEDSSKAVVYIYRPKDYLGSATAVSISINGTDIGKLKNGTKTEVYMNSEGVLKIEGKSNSPRCYFSKKIEVHQGETHYIALAWNSAASFKLIEMSETDGASAYYDDDLFKSNNMPVIINEGAKYHFKIYEKTFPDESKKNVDDNKIKSTGSGFYISSSGYLVTNYHVIEDYNRIMVRNISIDPTQKFKAEPVVIDKINDLVILKISDDTFESLPAIPYQMDIRLAQVGESVYALGFPLTQTMGTEVKLTNGIISSKTGFDGNVVTYQVSVPVQPGNSGGPLFDGEGNLIGIIVAVHNETDNVSYAIKANYLVNLINLLPAAYGFSLENSLREKDLPNQVKAIQNYVVLIEVY